MWLPLSFTAAILVGCSDAVVKKSLETSRSESIAWVRLGWAVLFLLPFFPWAQRPAIPWDFWWPVLCALPFEVAASLIFHKALKNSPLSLSIPFMAFTPVFVLATSRIFLGETIPFQGVIGVLCVTAGAFVLHPTKKGLQKGPLLILSVAFIYSFTAIMAKKAVLASSPLYFCTVYYAVIALCLIPFQMRSPTWKKELFQQPKLFALIGCLEALALVIQFSAVQTGNLAYVIAIKRLSLLLSVFLGWLIFKEKHFVSRIVGAALMATGAILIGFS